MDSGIKHVGISLTTEKEVLFEGEAKLRTDIQDLLATRLQFRRARRSRTTRYRQARFLNRRKSKGWLAPSVQHKVDSHINIVHFIHRILPVAKIIVEVAQFDTRVYTIGFWFYFTMSQPYPLQQNCPFVA